MLNIFNNKLSVLSQEEALVVEGGIRKEQDTDIRKEQDTDIRKEQDTDIRKEQDTDFCRRFLLF